MSEREKQIVQSIAESIKVIPKDKKEYVLGIAEGMALMSEYNNKHNQERK